MASHFEVESLEYRRLMSARVIAQYTQDGAYSRSSKDWAIRVTADGLLHVRGSKVNDVITVKSTEDGFSVGISRTKAAAARAGVARKIGATFTYRQTGTERIKVDGMGGTDRVITDTVTQQSVDTYGISNRAVELRTSKLIPDPFLSPLLGVYGGSNARWLKRSQADIDAVPEAKKRDAVLFLGDSLVDRLTSTGNAAFVKKFDPTRIVDLGLPGDTTSQMLYRIQYQGLLDGYTSPRWVVLCVGTNNVTLTDDADATARGIGAVVGAIRQRFPNVSILLNGVLPRASGNLAEYYTVRDVNDRLQPIASAAGAKFLDINNEFYKGTDPTYYNPNDAIHLSAKAYEKWIDMIHAAMSTPSVA